MAHDYLYLMHTCFVIAGLIVIFLVFRFQTIDTYADNRKDALRVMLDIKEHPERAEWIQRIGKKDIQEEDFDYKIIALNIPSAETFVNEINELRKVRHELVEWSNLVITIWGAFAVLYTLAYAFKWEKYIFVLSLLYLLPIIVTIIYFRWTLNMRLKLYR